MRFPSVSVSAAAIFLSGLVSANIATFDSEDHPIVCAGIYSKVEWGGSATPHIGLQLNEYDGVKYDKTKPSDKSLAISYTIFEYKDLVNIGVPTEDGNYKYICDDFAINKLKACDVSQKGRFIINPNGTNSTIYSSQITQLGPAHINYTVSDTGYYCVITDSRSDKHFRGAVKFQNAFGELSGSEVPKLPAYGILTICYAIALALYGFEFFKKRNKNQILPLQRYLLAMLGFLTFDTLVVWSYYDLVNRTKNTSKFVTFYMFMLSILNAAKITFAFFLLLCISLGYGVVVMKLKKSVMLKCKILAGCHFAASTAYLASSYYTGASVSTSSGTLSNQSSFGGFLFLLPLIPITVTLTIYYLAILVSIKKTTAKLHAQRQIIKLKLYESLFKIIFFSVMCTFAGLFLSSFIYLGMNSIEVVEHYWKGAYFLFDFWPSVVFFAVFMGVAWLWRPTETSYMLAISQQLSGQEVEEGEEGANGQGYHQGTEFELDDMSLMSHSDTEQHLHTGDDDSFELDRETQTVVDQEPPSYSHEDENADKVNPKNKNVTTEDNQNTLFEFGGDSDEEEEHPEDDRLDRDAPK
ncbi:hypothetical protein CAAN1_23S01244 [[Candida] anglica]|uniref:Membrane protein PTM1 n=1 Tax=[Candida] anglica TaxID=148631 RepID=A0ABP0EE52_9ASCO